MHSEVWSETRFLEAGAEWQELLSHSGGDPLFLSWHWMQVWWNIFRRDRDRLHLVAVYRSGKLIGLAPLYLNRGHDLKGRLSVRRLEMMGCRTGDHSGLRSEYLGFLLTGTMSMRPSPNCWTTCGPCPAGRKPAFRTSPSKAP